jgi:hypothetical protein
MSFYIFTSLSTVLASYFILHRFNLRIMTYILPDIIIVSVFFNLFNNILQCKLLFVTVILIETDAEKLLVIPDNFIYGRATN